MRKEISFTLLGVFLHTVIFAQTVPVAQTIPYTQDFNTLAASSTVFPAGWQGWQLSTAGSITNFRTTAPTANLALTASSTAATNTGGVHNFSGKLGILSSSTVDASLALVVNTTGKTNIAVTFDVVTIRNAFNGTTETRRNNVELQYRIGSATGAFTSLTGSIYVNNTTSQTIGTTPRNGARFQYILPVACENQAAVQLRWVQRDSSGAGGRPSFAVDNIIVCPAPLVAATVLPSCNGFNGSVNLTISAGLPPYTVSWDTINKNGPLFNVTAVNKTAQHPYFGIGFTLGFALDGIQGKELNLTRGINYVYNGTFPGHPFHISSSSAGGSFLNEISSGVTNSQLQGGALVFTPNSTHPALLYYQCGVHLNMGYKINISNGQLFTPSITGLTPGKYTASVSSSDGCITTLTVTVPQGAPIPPLPRSNSPVCSGTEIALTADEGDFYSWSGPGGFTSTDPNPVIPNATSVNAGFYYVTLTEADGCSLTDSVEVEVNVSPGIQTFTPVSGSEGDTVTVSGTGLLNVSGVTLGAAISNPTILNDTTLLFTIPPGATTDNLILSTENSCTDTSAVVFTVLNFSNLSLKCFVEGLYTNAGNQSNATGDPFSLVADTITVELIDPLNVSGSPVFTASGTVSRSGIASFIFPPAVIGHSYYIVLRHRNSIETWSKTPHAFTANTTFDFTQ